MSNESDTLPQNSRYKRRPLLVSRWAIWGGIILIGISFGVAYLIHIEKYDDNISEYWLSVLVGLFGVSIGWLIGMLGSPYSEEEERFSKYAGLLSTFVSGYLLSELKGTFTDIFSHLLGSDPIYSIRLILFIICLIVTMFMVYVIRMYLGDALKEAREDRIRKKTGSI